MQMRERHVSNHQSVQMKILYVKPCNFLVQQDTQRTTHTKLVVTKERNSAHIEYKNY